MSLLDHLKLHPGNWGRPAAPIGVTETPIAAAAAPIGLRPEWTDDPDGIWLPAGVVREGDQVHVAGRWHTVTYVDAYKGDQFDRKPGRVLMMFGGWQMTCAYVSQVCVLEEASAIATQIGGAK